MLFLSLMIVGTFFLGVSDILRRKHLVSGIDDQAMLVITLFLTGVLILPVFLILGFPIIQNGFWGAFWATVLLNLISQNLFIKAFKLSEASLIAPLRLITPPLVILSGIIILKETPSLYGILGIFITMIGLFFLLFKGSEGKTISFLSIRDRGVVYGLIASVMFAISFPFDKLTVIKSSALFTTFIVFTTLGILTYFINLISNKNFNLILTSVIKNNLKANIFISISSSLGVLFTNQALNYSLAAYGASLKRLWSLWTIVLSGKFLKEKDIGRKLVATIIMFVGIIISVIWK